MEPEEKPAEKTEIAKSSLENSNPNPCPLFLFQDTIPDDKEITDYLKDNGVKILNKKLYYESASDFQFNESKFMGLVALAVAQGSPVAIPYAGDFLNKKNTLSLGPAILIRAQNLSYNDLQYILITENKTSDPEKKKPSKENILLECVKQYGKIFCKKELLDYKVPTYVLKKSDVKVTCGFLTEYKDSKDKVVNGHVTESYNITMDEEEKIKKEREHFIGEILDSSIIKLMLDDGKSQKLGGDIVLIPKLGETAHITVNTIIKSSLSKLVLEKYSAGCLEFNLQDIDPNSKQNPKLTISKVADTKINITGWYCYAIMQLGPKLNK